ncbi:MAG TPA: HipA domain-containing protein [Streptosporangiaceae bacterium]
MHGEQEPDDDDPAEVDSAPESADHALRHSLAGVQLKYAVPGDSLTFPASGEGAWWIAKLPRPGLPDLLLNEYLTMRWLAAAGMNVPSVQLVPASAVGGIPAGMAGPQDPIYLIKRFDRSVSGRIHIEDFAQVAEVAPAFKHSRSGATYDSLGGAVLRLLGEAGYYEYVGRLTAMIITGNTDAHLKNWSLIYPDGKTPELSPLYDFQSLTLYTRYRYAPLALSLGAEDPSLPSLVVELDNFRVLAENAGAAADETVRVVQDAAERLRAAWSGELKAEADSRFPALSRHFAERLASLPICSA